MNPRHLFSGSCLLFLGLAAALPAFGLANRVFVSARSGNDANACDNVSTPCQTIQGAINQLNPNGEAIVLDSGAYAPVTITQGVTIEAPTGVTAFIHAPSGDAVTVNAGTATVTVRGLVLKVGTGNGIRVTSVGTLNVENCFIRGLSSGIGIQVNSGGRLNARGTDIAGCFYGIVIFNSTGDVQASLDHCHLDANAFAGYVSMPESSGTATTTATHTTANNNSEYGWWCAIGSGKDVLNLEFCTGSENGFDGLASNSTSIQNATRYSNCVFADNGQFGVESGSVGTFESRGNNTIVGNGTAQTSGTIGVFPPM